MYSFEISSLKVTSVTSLIPLKASFILPLPASVTVDSVHIHRLVIHALNLENHRPRSVGTAGYHDSLIVHPAPHNRSALQSGIFVQYRYFYFMLHRLFSSCFASLIPQIKLSLIPLHKHKSVSNNCHSQHRQHHFQSNLQSPGKN